MAAMSTAMLFSALLIVFAMSFMHVIVMMHLSMVVPHMMASVPAVVMMIVAGGESGEQKQSKQLFH